MTTPATPAADAVSLPDEFENVLFAEWLEAACVHVGAFGEVDGASEEDVRQLIRVCRERQTEAATARESALVAERDALRALLNDLGGTFHRLDTYGFIQAVGDEDENLCAHFLSCGRETMKQVVSALAAPAVEGE